MGIMHMKYCDLLQGITRTALGVLFIGICAMVPAHAQNCTGPDGAPGDIIYSSSFDVFQGCTPGGWMAFHDAVPPPSIDPCTTSSTPGTACADGQTVFAGMAGANRLYTTTADQSSAAYWGAQNTNLGANAQSSTNGLMNTNTALLFFENNPQAGACNVAPYNPPACTPNAHVLCQILRTTLGGDWYLPADRELEVLFNNGAAIGGFGNANYWASTENYGFQAFLRQYPSNVSDVTNKDAMLRVRCVRK